MNTLIKGTNLTKRYSGFSLEGVSLKVPTGLVVGFIGENGAGKTTTIKALLGLIRPDAGSVEAFGQPVSQSSAQWKQRIGVVFDTCPFPAVIHAGDLGKIGKAAYPTWDNAKFLQLLGEYGIEPGKTVKDLSRGMGMKLQLAFAFAHSPELLILDEPTAGLDPLARDEVLETLRSFMIDERHGILISSHITSDLERIADQIVCIHHGRIQFAESKDVICNVAGIARCTQAQLQELRDRPLFDPGAMRMLRRDFSTNVLVPDRFAFAQAFPQVNVEPANIDEYMALRLKGDEL